MTESERERERAQQSQAVLDAAAEGIWGVNREGLCTFVNKTASRLLGFSHEETVGQNMHALVHHHFEDGSEYPAEQCPIYNVFHNAAPFHGISDLLFRKDGSCFLAEVSAQPVMLRGEVSEVIVTFRDVSDARRKEQELKKAYQLAERRSAELHAVIESMPHGVYIATPDAGVRSNRRARAMSGEEFPKELGTLQKALAGESSAETVHLPGRWIHSVSAPILLNGEVLGGVAVNTDVTQMRLQDEALRKSEKLAAVGQLASSIAHEINNPLESITNLLYLIREAEEMDEVQQYAEIAQAELARVTEITLQTLRFHRQQSRPVEVDLADLLRTVMALYTGRLLVRNVSIEWRLMPSPRVICLEGEIRQVLNNLVRNALDAMTGKGGRLLIRLHSQHDSKTGAPGTRVTIADTGEGIDPAIAARLFEPFQTTKEQTGTGLGLWVSKGIIDKHSGTIRTRSRRREAHGTVFAVWLPTDGGVSLKGSED